MSLTPRLGQVAQSHESVQNATVLRDRQQTQPIWFTPYTEITTDALVPAAHAELRGPYAPPEATAPDATALRTLERFDPVENDPVSNPEYPW